VFLTSFDQTDHDKTLTNHQTPPITSVHVPRGEDVVSGEHKRVAQELYNLRVHVSAVASAQNGILAGPNHKHWW
jgi:hypothetical protein